MGKIPPSLRSAQFPLNAVTKTQSISDTATKPLNSPRYIRPKNTTKKTSPKPTINTNYQIPSSDLSAAKSLVDSLLPHDPSLDTKSVLQSYAATSYSSPASIDVSVRALCGANRLHHAVQLVKEFCLNNTLPDSYTYNFLLKRLCKDTDLTTVSSFITEMRECFNIKPDLISYTILIDNVCNRKNLREATRLLDMLAEDGFKPDLYVYNTIMKGHCMLGQGDVLGVFRKMKEQGLAPDLVTYNTLIFGLSKCGKVKEAMKFLNLMTEEGHLPDAVTYTSLMNGMCRERNVLGAVHLLGEMEAKGCVPNSCTYNTLLQGLCKERILEKAVEFFGVIRETGMKLESGSYGAYLRMLCKNGRVAEAYEVFDYAVESKSLKDVFAYSTLESTLKWLKKAREQGLVV